MELEELRFRLDQIDQELVILLVSRAKIVEQVGVYKKNKNLPVFDQTREQEKLDQIVVEQEQYALYLKGIFQRIMDMSKQLETQTLDLKEDM